MQVMSFLHKLVRPALSNIHKTRLDSLIETTDTLLNHGQLALTDLGRHVKALGWYKVNLKVEKCVEKNIMPICIQAHREPWLLATSLSEGNLIAQQKVAIIDLPSTYVEILLL